VKKLRLQTGLPAIINETLTKCKLNLNGNSVRIQMPAGAGIRKEDDER